jgi:hypothetical protein
MASEISFIRLSLIQLPIFLVFVFQPLVFDMGYLELITLTLIDLQSTL